MGLEMPRFMLLPESRKGRVLLGAAFLLVCASLAAGGYFWKRHADHLKSPAYAVEQLNEAILTKNEKLFATVFPSEVSDDFVLKLMDIIPDDFRSQQEPRSLALQMRALLNALLLDAPAPDFTQACLLPILPEDFFRQLEKKPFSLHKANAQLAVAESSFQHPSSKEEIKLSLAIGRSGDRWNVVGILNARELLSTYLAALKQEQQRLDRLLEGEQARHLRQMAHYLPDAVCTAGPMRISGGHPVLVLSLTSAPNPGPEIMESWGMEFPLTDDSGTILACPRLSESGKLLQGNELRRSWTMDLEEEDFIRLSAAGKLHCRVVPLYVMLDDGTMYSNDPRWLKRAGQKTTPSAHP